MPHASHSNNTIPSDEPNNYNITIESGLEVHFIDPRASTTIRDALTKTSFIIYICAMMAYIFLSSHGPEEDLDRSRIGRLV